MVVIDFTPPFAFGSNKTLILSSGRSSSFGASGSVLFGSIVTMCLLTYSHWCSTVSVEPSPNLTKSFPSNFPASSELLFDKSVTVACSISARTAVELLISAAITPFFQSTGSSFQTFIVTGASPPSSSTCSAADFLYWAL